MSSQRFYVFKTSTKCAACDLEGKYFQLEKNENDLIPHLNFYAKENDEQILMTKDHIRAKAYGGKNNLSNYQTMCTICNNIKGNSFIRLEDLKKLRDIYNLNKSFEEVFEEKIKYENKWPRINKNPNDLITKSDLYLYQFKDGLVAQSTWLDEMVAMIPKYKILKNFNVIGKQLVLKNENIPIYIPKHLVI